MRLTGNTRHRVQTLPFCGPRLVLQVEVAFRLYMPYRSPWGPVPESTMWRDARPEDLTGAAVVAQPAPAPVPYPRPPLRGQA